MEDLVVRKPPLMWWAGGLLLGLTQVLAVAVKKPLGVSTQFVVADTMAIQRVDAEYVKGHKLISDAKYQEFGYGWWLVVGLVGGVLILAGARLAHGCTSGQFASGWAQLSLSVAPFTAAMFATGMLAARVLYPKAPSIER